MKTLYWNTRGGCVELKNEKSITLGLKNGFIPLTEDEESRFNAGSYHPGHDQGTDIVVPPQQIPQAIGLKQFYVYEI